MFRAKFFNYLLKRTAVILFVMKRWCQFYFIAFILFGLTERFHISSGIVAEYFEVISHLIQLHFIHLPLHDLNLLFVALNQRLDGPAHSTDRFSRTGGIVRSI